jgi:CheY-like chemotaxis protein
MAKVLTRAAMVLICDDEPDIRALYRIGFEHEAADVHEAEDGIEGIEQATALQPDLVVLDIAMPRRDGLSALPEIRAAAPAAKIVVVTAHSAVEVFDRARSLGASACFEKLAFLERIPAVLARYAR